MNSPHILVISNNCLSETNSNGRTLSGLLRGWNPDCIAQLYIYPSIPDTAVCSRFFRITDYEMLQNFLFHKACGEVVLPDHQTGGASSLEADWNTRKTKFKKGAISLLIREFLWKFGNWKSSELLFWIKEFKPDCVLLQAGNTAFICNIACKLCREFGDLPLFVYNSEDYYLKSIRGISFIKRINKHILHHAFDKMMQEAYFCIYSCEMLYQSYQKYFKTPGTVIYTASNMICNLTKYDREIPVISYIGNTGVDRWRALDEFAKELQSINSDYILDVYAPEPEEAAKRIFQTNPGIHYNGFINYEQAKEVISSSDLLLQAEYYSEFIKEDLRHSFSTKIADYLASGRCIFVYAPDVIASTQYLKENDAACVAKNRQELSVKLREILSNEKLRAYYSNRALELAKLNHDSSKISETFKSIILEYLMPKESFLCRNDSHMKILQVNCVYQQGSTGKIMKDIAEVLTSDGYPCVICYGRGSKEKAPGIYKTSSEFLAKINALKSRITGLQYNGAFFATNKLLHIIKAEKPDIVHLHCINGYFVNIYRLLKFLKKHNIKTVLTLHAEFMFTGSCGYSISCDKWALPSGCRDCPQLTAATYSWFFDRTHTAWLKMKKAFRGFDHLVVVSVSPWLMNRAKQSPILADKVHKTVLNGIDTGIFCPRSFSHIKERYSLTNEKILLHVTPNFTSEMKGGRYIRELAERLKDKNIIIVVIGNTDHSLKLPPNIIDVGRIKEQQELAAYYSIADLTVLASKRETYSMVCAESLACGTPVVGFQAGAPEQIALAKYSCFVPYADLQALEDVILEWCDKKRVLFSSLSADASSYYSKERMTREYIEIYQKLMGSDR